MKRCRTPGVCSARPSALTQCRDDVGWRAGRRDDSVPGFDRETRDGQLGDGRELRRGGRPARARNGQEAKRPGLRVGAKQCKVRKHHVDLTAHEGRNRRCRATIRNMNDIDMGRGLEHFGSQARRAAGTARSIRQSTGIGTCMGDQLGNRRHRQARPHREGIGDGGGTADRHEIPHWIVLHGRSTNATAMARLFAPPRSSV